MTLIDHLFQFKAETRRGFVECDEGQGCFHWLKLKFPSRDSARKNSAFVRRQRNFAELFYCHGIRYDKHSVVADSTKIDTEVCYLHEHLRLRVCTRVTRCPAPERLNTTECCNNTVCGPFLASRDVWKKLSLNRREGY